MAVDSWVPHRFAALSERLTTQNGILLMGAAALAALLYTSGNVGHLVVMYSINVFLTFSLSMLAMLRFWHQHRRTPARVAPAPGALCRRASSSAPRSSSITVFEKFAEGGWVTVVITVARHRSLLRHPAALPDRGRRSSIGCIASWATFPARSPRGRRRRSDSSTHSKPTAAVLVGSYGGVGIHTVLNVFRAFPGHFKSLVFLSVGVVDSGEFKGEHAVEDLRQRTEEMLARYVALAAGLGIPATAPDGHRDGGGGRSREALPARSRASSRRSCSSRAR